MLTLGDILPDAQRILGGCDTAYVKRRINSAIELLANKGDFDPYLASVDLVAVGRILALPSEVETVLAVNIMGRPTQGLSERFTFHLNGPGDMDRTTVLGWRWKDEQESPVFTDAPMLGKLYVRYDGVACPVSVEGVGADGVLTEVTPTVVPAAQLATWTPTGPTALLRIARVRHLGVAAPNAVMTLCVTDPDAPADRSLDRVLAVYRPQDWPEPKFKRIILDRPAEWVRVLFRRRTRPLSLDTDLIPLFSPEAVLAMIRSLKCYDEMQFEAATAYEATALRWLSDEQRTRRAPLMLPPQVNTQTSLLPAYDHLT